jgi:hypothetical protein
MAERVGYSPRPLAYPGSFSSTWLNAALTLEILSFLYFHSFPYFLWIDTHFSLKQTPKTPKPFGPFIQVFEVHRSTPLRPALRDESSHHAAKQEISCSLERSIYAATEGLWVDGNGFTVGRFFFNQSAISPGSKRIAPEILNEGMVPLAAIL